MRAAVSCEALDCCCLQPFLQRHCRPAPGQDQVFLRDGGQRCAHVRDTRSPDGPRSSAAVVLHSAVSACCLLSLSHSAAADEEPFHERPIDQLWSFNFFPCILGAQPEGRVCVCEVGSVLAGSRLGWVTSGVNFEWDSFHNCILY